MTPSPTTLVAVMIVLGGAARGAGGDWPMLGHDVARSGATAAEVRPPVERKWVRALADEGIVWAA